MAVDIRLVAALCLTSIFAAAYGGHVIMVPKFLQLGGMSQVCVVVDDPSAPAGEITMNATADVYRWGGHYNKAPQEDQQTVVITPLTTIPVQQGKVDFCFSFSLEDTEFTLRNEKVSIQGNIAGENINYTAQVKFAGSIENTIVQTDKYLYQPGQLVRFRILSHQGPLMNISRETIPEVWVTTPSKTRIAQWREVDNSAGLVHLEMQLADEPEEGMYKIHVKTRWMKEGKKLADFKVEEYVLPRFEVTIEPPKYFLASDPSFSFKVCAKYTFGQPVNGALEVQINNNGYEACNIVVTKNETISGCQDIEVSSADIRTVDCSVNSVAVMAKVTEEGTGVRLNQRSSISVSRNAVSFKTLYQDKYMKHNLPYTMKVQSQLPDGSPAEGVLVEVCYDGGCKNITTPTDGIMKIHVTKYDSRRVVMKSLITRVDMYDDSLTTNIERYYSPSQSSLLIHAPEGEIECIPGDIKSYNLRVLFATPDLTSAEITVQVMSRDMIQYWDTKVYQLNPSELPLEDEYQTSPESSGKVGVINIPLELPQTVSPAAWVLIWYVRDDGEVVSDAREVKMKKCLPNSVHFRWSMAEAQPGQDVSFSLASEPDSICSFGVVDKSVELLTPESNALTVETFFSGIERHRWRYSQNQVNDYEYCNEQHPPDADSHRRYFRVYTDYVDALKMFDDADVFVFSDHRLETRPCVKLESAHTSHSRGGAGGGGGLSHYPVMSYDAQNSGITEIVTEIDSSTSPRTDFPETWLWDLVVIPPQGEAIQHVSMPDTITEWVGNSVCVHPQKGVGVSRKASITSFTPFFLDLTLPPSIKRGEILPVKISVFNYMDEDLPVTLILEDSPEYGILEASTAQQSLCVESHDMSVYSVRIRPSIIGDVNITVSAFVDHQHSASCGTGSTQVQKSDALIRSVLVEAEGFPREETWTNYICSQELTAGESSLENWDVRSPANIVEGSERGWVMVVGDLLALSVENLGHLIRMPYGCGEQNMLNFAPNIFIMQYLEATNQDAPEAKEKLLRFMKTGYHRQLLYLHDDGSFSAFGNADDSGSTWLTAFVLKSFAQAQQYILVDQKTINRSVEWLQKTQEPNGCFQSIGTLFNKAMKGGLSESGTSAPLTAYAMISLLEFGKEPTSPEIVTGMECLRSHITHNRYLMALNAYAFALAQDTQTPQLLQELLSEATETKYSLHWELSQNSWRSQSLEVETAGYAILAMLTWEPNVYEVQARKIVKWISSKRNGQGGFISTQDTVVALQAMASFESHLGRRNLNAVVTVQTSDSMRSFAINQSNKLLMQQISIPSLPTTVSLGMTGEGCVLMQAVLRYNIPDPEPSDAFSLTVTTRTVRDKNCITKRVSACVSYLLPDAKSNMAVIEVNLVSGYIPEKADLKKLVKQKRNAIKRYEVDGSKVSFYFEEITTEEVCINFKVLREVNVENVKPGSVIVYDYYQPEFSISKSYTLPAPDDCKY